MINSNAVRELYPASEPDYAIPPGETLLEFLEESGMTQRELAIRADLSPKHVNQLIKGTVSLSPETAEKLERVTGIRARFWNRLEADYQSTRERLRLTRDPVIFEAWMKDVPWRELLKRGELPDAPSDKASRWEQLLAFFGVATLDAWVDLYERPAVAFRQAKSFEASAGAVATWLRLGEVAAQSIRCAPYSKDKLRASIPELRRLTVLPPDKFEPEMVRIAAECGVAVVFVKEIPGSRASGATRWLSPGKVAVQLSLRYKTDDQLWFTFFHELGHVLLHGKQDIRIEGPENPSDPQEDEANAFARDTLIPSIYSPGLERIRSLSDVRSFAQKIGVAPGIVVGRLHHEKLRPYNWGNGLKRRFELVE
ncbi:XRE family transcriptional regulator [Kitasatospora herbaricolor]|uniref:helix-turn-helix domain-containing protein n=1 Tax=Kitasatospora herbaricolor TaxID=68217 RepID=UPI00174D6863|nr:helix-turn-helix domain-containing protein [Kitasatospora herbaricolor]MDQ0309466.1 HTH-type transcriptional regulator/antitoxin HigA [Kitasatospora herbaricolor]GGV01657.1 XRE family transcriptional regulator [Kitasatospora herbaricolor]